MRLRRRKPVPSPVSRRPDINALGIAVAKSAGLPIDEMSALTLHSRVGEPDRIEAEFIVITCDEAGMHEVEHVTRTFVEECS